MEKYLHKRITDNCYELFKIGKYREAATTACTEVELGFKEKTGETNLFGQRMLHKYLNNDKQSIKLSMPFGEEMQNQTEKLFKATFAYYRNYCAHDGRKIDEIICLRILILTSELLDLLDVSDISYSKIGGADGLISNKIFESKERIGLLLDFLSGQSFPYEVYDGMFEEMYGFLEYTEEQYHAMFDLGFVVYKEEFMTAENVGPNDTDWEGQKIGWLELTDLGKTVMSETINGAVRKINRNKFPYV